MVSYISKSLCQTLQTKRQPSSKYAQDYYIGLARSKISLRLGPCAKSAVPVHSVCIPAHYDICSFTDSIPPLLATPVRSRAGGSEPRESAADSFVDRSRSMDVGYYWAIYIRVHWVLRRSKKPRSAGSYPDL